MLPSGNDAAQAICENLGKILQTPMLIRTDSLFQSGKEIIKDNDGSQVILSSTNLVQQPIQSDHQTNMQREDQNNGKKKKEPPTRPFLLRMNKIAESLGMINTVYCNPHGLMNKFNFSSCLDVARLLVEAYKNPIFTEVISAQSYSTVITRYGEQTTVEWTNTHKCFDDKRFLGGKTGTTVAAGACLATLMKLENGKNVAIVVLNSKDL